MTEPDSIESVERAIENWDETHDDVHLSMLRNYHALLAQLSRLEASQPDMVQMPRDPTDAMLRVFSPFVGAYAAKILYQQLVKAAPHTSEDLARDSTTLGQLIAQLRARESVGRRKYGTDVDRDDLTNDQWRQHLREELMDALLYSLAEERTVVAHG